MPRHKRTPSPTGIYHWITRGVNRKMIFRQHKDYVHFLSLAAECVTKFNVRIFHYCLMTNHIHMLIHAPDLKCMIGFSYYLKRLYAYYQSKTYKITGSTFERMYRSKPVHDDVQLLECARYIDRNPLRAGICSSLGSYPYSSYSVYAGGITNQLITLSPAYLALASTDPERQRLYADHVNQYRPQEEFADKSTLNL